MSRRKRKIVYKDGEGKEYKIEGSVLDLSQGSLEELIGDALAADQDDKILKEKSKEIKEFIENSSNIPNKLERWYELGKKLQFVDTLNLNSEEDRKQALERLFKDLKASSPIWRASDSKAIRYPQHMYTLSKLPREIVFYAGMTWARWFDILEYKVIINNTEILRNIVERCTVENWNEEKLRHHLQKINKELREEK